MRLSKFEFSVCQDKVGPDCATVTLDKQVTELQYRPDSGLFAKTDEGEIKITDIVPFCLPDGQLVRSRPHQIEPTTDPDFKLPAPPKSFKQRISFNIFYPVEADADAASSFVVFENGEVWCTERFGYAGQSGAAAFGLAGFFILSAAVIVFAGSFVVILLLAVIALEIYRWQKTRRKATSMR